jgi:glycosyltransferase involved in cell wall biosynthesis
MFVIPLVCRKYNLDVFIGQNFISPFGRYRKIVYVHDVLFETEPQFYTILERLYFQGIWVSILTADCVVTVSNAERRRILGFRIGKLAKQIEVVHHGVSTNFKPRSEFSDEEFLRESNRLRLPKQYILYVGRLNVRKNVEALLRALGKLTSVDLKLLIVGAEDWKSSDYKGLINELGIAAKLQFTGFVENPDLPTVYAGASGFCFPSKAESFGLPALEALSAGIPCIVSKIDALEEVCGESGIFIDPDSPDEIAEAIVSVLQHKGDHDRRAKLGITRAAGFSWSKSAEQLLKVCT